MIRKYKFHKPEGIYFVSFATVNWIDVFSRRLYKDILVESINYCLSHKGLQVYAWVIMSKHIHMVESSNEVPLEDIFRDMKKNTHQRVFYKLWKKIHKRVEKNGCCGCLRVQGKRIQTIVNINFGNNTINPKNLVQNICY